MRSRSDKYCIECRDVGGKRKSLDNYKQEGFTILSVDNSIVNYRCNGCHSSISRGIAHAKRSEYIVCNKCNPYRVMGTKINTPDGRFDSMFEYKAYLKLVSILGKHNIIRQKPYDELFSTKTKHTADFYIPKLDLVLEVTTKYNKISDKYRNTAEWKMGISNKVIFAYTIAEVEDIVRTSLKEGDNSLQTAEMYYAASLSGDTNLQNVFRSGGDFHSAVAKQAFNLECGVDQVKDLYPKLRQGSKAVSFGVK
jgi:DNA-directed RNA polymerase subunit RPC12/RpoP